MRTDLNPLPESIHGYPVLAYRPATHAASEICVVVLVRREDHSDYVTWTYNLQCPGASGGKYGQTLDEAADDFATRHGRRPLGHMRHSDVAVCEAATLPERVAVRDACTSAPA